MTLNNGSFEEDRLHKHEVLRTEREKLRHLERQAARYEDIPFHISNSINECGQKIDELEHQLSSMEEKLRSGSKVPIFITSKREHPRVRVFIGSASLEILKHRDAVKDIIWRSDSLPFEKETTSWNEHLQLIDEAEIFVGVIGVRYGDIPDENNEERLSCLELEYRRATQRRIPTLIYSASEENQDFSKKDYFFDSDKKREQLANFIDEVRKKNHLREFDNIEQLREYLRQDLEDLVIHRFNDTASTSDIVTPGVEDIPQPPEPYYHPEYTLTRTFFGRTTELQQLEDWVVSKDSTIILEAIGGMGKSAIAWEWVHQYAPHSFQPRGVIWWSFYEPQATLKRFARHALAYITRQDPDDAAFTNLSYDDLTSRLTTALRRGRYLVILDGLERLLVAYWRIERTHLPDFTIADGINDRDCAEVRDGEFLRQLASVKSSKILICSRLLPFALEDLQKPGETIHSVRRLHIDGLSPKDAADLFRDLGVTQANSTTVQNFLRHLGYHALLIKLIAAHISRDFRRAPGNFDRWYDERGKSLDLASIASPDLPNHILFHALAGLDDDKRQLLTRLAAFSGPIEYMALAAFFVPSRPPIPSLPARIRTRPHPFGSPEIATLRGQYAKAANSEEKASIQAAIDQQEAAETEWFSRIERNRVEIEEQAKGTRTERLRLLDRLNRDYLTSPEYLYALNELDAALRVLEDRGLIEWDRQQNTYDLHPVVRSYAMRLLSADEQKRVFGYVLDHFAAIPAFDEDSIIDVYQIHHSIETHRTLARIGEFDDAAQFYTTYLRVVLNRLEISTLIIELLEPLFEFNSDVTPKFTVNIELLSNTLGRAMSQVCRYDEAKQLHLLSFKLNASVKRNYWNIYTDIGNYGGVFRKTNKIVAAKRFEELATALCPSTDLGWASLYSAQWAVLTGHWIDAKALIDEAWKYGAPVNYPEQWRAGMAREEAKLCVFQGLDTKDIFESSLSLYEVRKYPLVEKDLHYLYAIVSLGHSDVEQAFSQAEAALRIARNYDYSCAPNISLLARIELARGHRKRALELVEQALRTFGRDLEDEVRVVTDAAEIFHNLGNTTRSKQYALRAYELAWADGPPNSRWWELERVTALLNILTAVSLSHLYTSQRLSFTVGRLLYTHEQIIMSILLSLAVWYNLDTKGLQPTTGVCAR